MAKMLTIEIGYSTTKAVLMDYKTRKPKVYKSAEFETTQGAVVDGYIVTEKLDELCASLKKGLKKNKLKAKRVVFTVGSGKIITREIVLPGVKEHQINAIIQSNITEYFPVELDDYRIAHIKITTFKDGENAGKHKVLVIAAENKLIKGYEKLADELKLKIVDIDYAGNSTFQAVRRSAGADAIMVVKVEEENTLITIAKQGTLVLQRNVNYNVGTQVEAERVGMEESVHTIVGTVQRVIDFYESSETGGKINKVYLVGDGSKSDNILKVMQDQIQVDFAPLDIVRGVSLKRKAKKNQLSVFATVIGAGIASVGFDNEREKARHETNYAAASFLMLILIGVVGVAMLSMSLIPYNTALIEQHSLEKKRQDLEPAKVVYDQYNGMLDLMAKVRYGQALTRNSNDGILDFLDELEKTLPEDVEVSDFSSDESQCVISMRVADKETAAGVINNLRQFESISSLSVDSIVEETMSSDGEVDALSSEDKIVSFTVTAVYRVDVLVEPVSNTQTVE
jgi:Tfp pilus assembly PilM family ATPase